MATPPSSSNSTAIVPQVSNAPIPGNQPPNYRPQVSASLYIGDLDSDIGESALYDLFKEIGAVASIRVCRDAISRASLGYAYVNFHNIENAERAISVLNGAMLNKRPCRIMWSKRDPTLRKTNVGNIFIKNLDPEIDLASLYDLFSTFGNILSCKLVTGNDGKSKGYGFVHYQTKESAETAIQQMSNKKLNGKVVYVAPFIPSKDRPKKNPEETFTNVYIKNIAENVTQEMLKEHFSQFGEITSCVLMENKDTKKPLGFGFANYKTHDEAVLAVKNANGVEFHGKSLYAARAQPKDERLENLKKYQEKLQGTNLYIKNIDDNVTEEKLHKYFSEFGTITSIKIMTTEKGVSKGFGFVCFSNQNEATKALTKMNNAHIEGKPLYVAIAERKEQRKQKLEQQHSQTAFRNMGVHHHQPLISNFPPNFYPRGPRGGGYPQSYNRGYPFPMNPPNYRTPPLTQARGQPTGRPQRGQPTTQQISQPPRTSVQNLPQEHKPFFNEIVQVLLSANIWNGTLVNQIADHLTDQSDTTLKEWLSNRDELLNQAQKLADNISDQPN